MNQTKDQKVRRLAFKVSEMSINYESPSAIPGEIFLLGIITKFESNIRSI